jgi:Fic family protein
VKKKIQGTITIIKTDDEQYGIYFPYPLPPKIAYEEISVHLEKANKAIGELNGVVESVSSHSIVNYMYVRKEAVLSSQIEGTQSTLDDLLKYEFDYVAGLPINDVEEVSSYVNALNYGLKRLETFPLSLRLIREVHSILLKNSRGKTKNPGEFRTSQNWIGGTRPGNARFVPVSPDRLFEALSAFEKFMQEDENIPILVKAALIHYQFETIHPFLDGNGRIGRLLITLYLYEKKFLKSPCLYLSLFLKKNRFTYYKYINDVRFNGSWEQWINFFLEGIMETANEARNILQLVQDMFKRDLETISTLKRAKDSATIVFKKFEGKPLLSISELVKTTGLSKPTVGKAVGNLIKFGIIKPATNKSWGQIYAYQKYIDTINSSED